MRAFLVYKEVVLAIMAAQKLLYVHILDEFSDYRRNVQRSTLVITHKHVRRFRLN